MAVDRDGNRMEPPIRAYEKRVKELRNSEGLGAAKAGQKAYRQLLDEKHKAENKHR
jgi:hypothetical protein